MVMTGFSIDRCRRVQAGLVATVAVVAITGWKRLAVASRPPVGTYRPRAVPA